MKRGTVLLLFLFLLVYAAPRACASGDGAFHPALLFEEGRGGDVADLVLSYDGSLGPIGTFLVRVEYDTQVFAYVRTQKSPVLQEGYVTVAEMEDAAASAYTMKTRETCLETEGETFAYRFRVREGAQPGKSRFFVSVYEITSPDAEELGRDTDETVTYTVLPPPSSDASLRSLTPASGSLVPAFSPEVFQYRMTVPFSVKEMTFSAGTAPGATCRTNRKNLGAGGSETDFVFTVTAEDGETKQEYRVTVLREEKTAAFATEKPAASQKPATTRGPAPTPKPASTPKPGKTSKPEGTTVSAAKRTPSPRPAVQKTPVPAGSSGGTPAVPGDKTGTGPGAPAAGNPTLIIRNGDSSFVPFMMALLVFALAVLGSGPFSRWWCRKFPEEKKSSEEKDGEEK